MSPENVDATDAMPPHAGAMEIRDGRERELVLRVVGTDEAVTIGKGQFMDVVLDRPPIEDYGREPWPVWRSGPTLTVTAVIKVPVEPLPKYGGHDPDRVEGLAAIIHESRSRRHIRSTSVVTTERGWIHCIPCQDRALRMLAGSEGWRLAISTEDQ